MEEVFRGLPNGLVFVYQTKRGNEIQTIRCHPVSYSIKDGEQLLYAYDVDREKLRTFYLSRIIAFPVVV